MIVTEQLTINDRQFTKTYSDSGFMVECDGAQYSEADDFAYQTRTYEETDEPIDPVEESDEIEQKAAAFDYLTGRSAVNE